MLHHPEQDSIAACAREYIARYGMALVPLPPRSKRPLTEDWGRKLLTDPDDAAAFFEAHPDWNVGVALGPSRLCSLDVDDIDSMRIICEEMGWDLENLWQSHPTVKGKDTGFRIMFRVPAGVTLPYQRLTWPKREGVGAFTVFEIRAADEQQRQDVLPPSIHPETGTPYLWITSPNGSIPEPPKWLLSLWTTWGALKPQLQGICPWSTKAENPARQAAKAAPRTGESTVDQWNEAHDIEAALQHYGYKPSGKRYISPHSTTGLAGVTVWREDNKCYIHHASDPLCSDDSGRPVSPFDLFCQYEHGGDFKRAARAAESVLGIQRPRKELPVPPMLKNAIARASEGPQSAENEPGDDLAPLDWLELENKEPEPVHWALEGWLPKGHITLLSANGGVGKSGLSLQLATCISLGMPFIGMQTEQGKVVVISAEDDAKLVHLRMRNVCAHYSVPMRNLRDRLNVYDVTQEDCLLWRDGAPTSRMGWLAGVVERDKPSVVILDNASDLFADNENDRTMVRGFLRCLKSIAAKYGCAILLLAHVDKASVRMGAGRDTDSTFSGSTAWNNSARSRWAMIVGDDKREIQIRHEKCNVGRKQEEFSVEYDQTAHVFREFGTVPGAGLAASLLRNAQRAAILKMIYSATQRGINLSTKANASNSNIYKVLNDDPDYPKGLDRKGLFSHLRDLEYEGLIAQEVYKKSNRTPGERLVLTQSGQARVLIGSGAGSVWAQRRDEEGASE